MSFACWCLVRVAGFALCVWGVLFVPCLLLCVVLVVVVVCCLLFVVYCALLVLSNVVRCGIIDARCLLTVV